MKGFRKNKLLQGSPGGVLLWMMGCAKVHGLREGDVHKTKVSQ